MLSALSLMEYQRYEGCYCSDCVKEIKAEAGVEDGTER